MFLVKYFYIKSRMFSLIFAETNHIYSALPALGGVMKRVSDIIICILLGVMLAIIIGEGILLYKIISAGNDDHSISVEIADGESGVAGFEHLNLVPGSEVKYTLTVNSSDGPTYAVDFEFRDRGDSPLQDYVYVRMLIGEEEICDSLLADVMDSGAISHSIKIDKGEPCEVTIIYYMPEDIGNEAEGAEAHFDIYVTGRFE